MPSLQSVFFRFMLKHFTDWSLPLDKLRTKTERNARWGGKLPKKVEVNEVTAGGVAAEWLQPAGAAPDRVMLYLHGGGYAIGSCATHRGMAARLAESCGVRALVLNYRLAPEHPFPAALEDSVAAYRWLLQQGVSPRDIVIAGDSAGGGLAVAMLVTLRDAGEPLPGAAVCISPWTDLAGTGESIKTRAKADPWVTAESLALGIHYVGAYDTRHPLISPLYAELHGLPPLLIQVGSDEIVLSDSTRLAERVKIAGGEATLEVWEGMWHVFHCLAPQLPEANRAIEKIGAFVRRQIG